MRTLVALFFLCLLASPSVVQSQAVCDSFRQAWAKLSNADDLLGLWSFDAAPKAVTQVTCPSDSTLCALQDTPSFFDLGDFDVPLDLEGVNATISGRMAMKLPGNSPVDTLGPRLGFSSCGALLQSATADKITRDFANSDTAGLTFEMWVTASSLTSTPSQVGSASCPAASGVPTQGTSATLLGFGHDDFTCGSRTAALLLEVSNTTLSSASGYSSVLLSGCQSTDSADFFTTETRPVHIVFSLSRSPSFTTALYRDGALVAEYSPLVAVPSDPFVAAWVQGLTRMTLGNTPSLGSSWLGDIFSLAIYGRVMQADEVRDREVGGRQLHVATPYLEKGSLRIVSGEGTSVVVASPGQGSHLILGEAEAGTKVSLRGQRFAFPAMSVYLGSQAEPNLYECLVDVGSSNSTYVECTLPTVLGRNYVFQVRYKKNCFQSSWDQARAQNTQYYARLPSLAIASFDVNAYDRVSAPTPVIQPHSVRLCAAEATSACLSQPGVSKIELTNTNAGGAIIAFRGANFGEPFDVTKVSVTVGGEKCSFSSDVLAFANDTVIMCRLGSGTGKDQLIFVELGGYSINGSTDNLISFPETAQVYSVTPAVGGGCVRVPVACDSSISVQASAALGGSCFRVSDCPTGSQIFLAQRVPPVTQLINITGIRLSGSCVVTVDGNTCTNQEAFTLSGGLTSIVCELPKGVGVFRPVIVTCDGLPSPVAKYVSYKAPSVFQVSSTGCELVVGLTVNDCPRKGNVVITIDGADFGSTTDSDGNFLPAIVLVGGQICSQVTHAPVPTGTSVTYALPNSPIPVNPDSRLTCVLPQGSDDRDVLVAQAGGLISSSGMVLTYKACDPGSYGGTAAFNYECPLCDAGKVSAFAGSSNCTICEPGTYANTSGMTACEKCGVDPLNTYSPSFGATSCLECPFPTFSTGAGALSCAECGADTYFASGRLAALTYSTGGTNVIDADRVCLSCVNIEGVTCTEGIMVSNRGYWVYTDPATGVSTSYRCASDSACLELNTCGAHRRAYSDNIVCGECVSDFYEWGGDCVDCSGGTRVALVFLLVLVSWGYVMIFHRVVQNSVGYTRIFLYFVQIAFLLVASDSEVLSYLAIFNFNILSSETGGTCLGTMSAVQRLWMGITMPLASWSLLGLTFGMHVVYFYRVQLKRNPNLGGFRTTPYRRTAIALALFSYNSISETVCQFLQCRTIVGEEVIGAYPTISCLSSEYRLLRPFMYIVLILFVVGMPVGILVFLLVNRNRLEDRKLKQRWGLLYEVYSHKSAHYYEFFAYTRRLVLIGANVALFFESRERRFSVLACLCLVFMLVHAIIMPFKAPLENLLELINLASLTLLSILLSQVSVPLSTYAVLVFAVLVLGPAVTVAYFIGKRQVNKLRHTMGSFWGMTPEGPASEAEMAKSESHRTAVEDRYDREREERMQGQTLQIVAVDERGRGISAESHGPSSSQYEDKADEAGHLNASKNTLSPVSKSHSHSHSKRLSGNPLPLAAQASQSSEPQDTEAESRENFVRSLRPVDVHNLNGDEEHEKTPLSPSDSNVELSASTRARVPPGWMVFQNDNGVPYYVNRETNQTVWDVSDMKSDLPKSEK